MGYKSTFDIDRQTAISIILSKVTTCTNEQLASILLDFEESYFRNYAVYDKLPEDDDNDGRVIRDVRDF